MHIRISILDTGRQIANCVFDPINICRNPGFWPEISGFVASLLVKPEDRDLLNITFIRSTRWSWTNLSVVENGSVAQRGVLDHVYYGTAELTSLHMSLDYDRNQWLDSLAPLLFQHKAFFYKPVRLFPPPYLDVLSLLPIQVYLLFLACGVACKVCQNLTYLFGGNQGRLVWFWLVYSLIAAILLNYLASNVVLLFNRPRHSPQPFRRTEDILKAIARKDYQAIVSSSFDREYLLLLAHEKNLSLVTPVVVHDADVTMQLLLNSRSGTKYMYYATDSEYVLGHYCVGSLEDKLGSLDMRTMFVRKEILKLALRPLSPSSVNVIQNEAIRLNRKYNRLKACNVKDVTMEKRFKQLQPKALSIAQVMEIFFLLLGVFGASLLTFWLELMCGIKFLRERKKLKMNLSFKNEKKEEIKLVLERLQEIVLKDADDVKLEVAAEELKEFLKMLEKKS